MGNKRFYFCCLSNMHFNILLFANSSQNGGNRRDLERMDYPVTRHPEFRYKTEFQSHEPEVFRISAHILLSLAKWRLLLMIFGCNKYLKYMSLS